MNELALSCGLGAASMEPRPNGLAWPGTLWLCKLITYPFSLTSSDEPIQAVPRFAGFLGFACAYLS